MQWYNYMSPKRLVNGLRGVKTDQKLNMIIPSGADCVFFDQTTLKISYEPCCEKTGLRGFRPGQTQNGLYSYRS